MLTLRILEAEGSYCDDVQCCIEWVHEKKWKNKYGKFTSMWLESLLTLESECFMGAFIIVVFCVGFLSLLSYQNSQDHMLVLSRCIHSGVELKWLSADSEVIWMIMMSHWRKMKCLPMYPLLLWFEMKCLIGHNFVSERWVKVLCENEICSY